MASDVSAQADGLEEAHMLQSSGASQGDTNAKQDPSSHATPAPTDATDCVRCVLRVAAALGCAGVWARTTGPYILLGLRRGDAFARLIALGGTSYGLAFRAPSTADKRAPAAWDPILLIDELADAVEHALVGLGGEASSSA